jgi:hypothetical protein
MHRDGSALVEKQIASGLILFGCVPANVSYEFRTASFVGRGHVGPDNPVERHAATFGHMPEVVGAESGFDFPTDENAAVMGKRSGGLSIRVEPGIGEQGAIRGKHVKVGLKLSVAVDEPADRFAPFQEIDFFTGRVFVLAGLDFPVSCGRADATQAQQEKENK